MNTPTPNLLLQLREQLGELKIATRTRGDTHHAKLIGAKRSCTCTMSAEQAARNLAEKVFGVPSAYIEVSHAVAYYVAEIKHPEQLSNNEALALWALAQSGIGGDITSPALARNLRDLHTRRPDLVVITNVEARKSGWKPYFGAVLTAAGREALKKADAQVKALLAKGGA